MLCYHALSATFVRILIAHKSYQNAFKDNSNQPRLFTLTLWSLTSQANEGVISSIETRSQQLTDLSDLIWDLAEVGYQETRSSEALKSALSAEGFSIESGVADIPTAFVASYGSGEPVIAVMGEFDALPGISQAAVPLSKKSKARMGSGLRPSPVWCGLSGRGDSS